MARISYVNPDDLQDPELCVALHQTPRIASEEKLASLNNFEKSPLCTEREADPAHDLPNSRPPDLPAFPSSFRLQSARSASATARCWPEPLSGLVRTPCIK